MQVFRNLLIYCSQEKMENMYADLLLSMVNLDVLKEMMKSKEFDFYLNEYRKKVDKNRKYREKKYPSIKFNNPQ